MDFNEFYLTETVEEIYHATSINSLYNIIKDNSIKMTLSTGSDSLVNRGKYYYLSAMRVKYGNYAGGKYIGKEVVIDLNRNSIRDIAKIKSVDYWGKGFNKGMGSRDEQEERIMSDKSELSPLSKYVNSIHVYIGDKGNNISKEKLEYIRDESEKKGVRVYFYDKGEETAFKMQRKERSTTNFDRFVKGAEGGYKIVYKAKDGSHYVEDDIYIYKRERRRICKKGFRRIRSNVISRCKETQYSYIKS